MNHAWLQTYFFVGLLLATVTLLIVLLKPFLGALVLAITFAVILEPLYRVLLKAVPYPSIAALLTTLLLLVIVFVPLIFLGLRLFNEARLVYSQLTANDTFFLSHLAPRVGGDFNQYARQIVAWLIANAATFFSSVAQTAANLFLSLLAFYYLLKDGPALVRELISLSPLADRYDQGIVTRLHAAVNSVVRGSLIIAVLQGISTGLGFTIFGIPHPIVWGSVAIIAALVPTVGTALILAPGIGYLLIQGDIGASIGLLIWGATAVGLIDNLLGPKLMEHGIRIHPLLILLAVLGGLGTFGPTGFLIGPLTLSLLFALMDIYKHMIKSA